MSLNSATYNFFSSSFVTTYTEAFTELLKLCTNTSKRIIAGKTNYPEENRSQKILTILLALDSDLLTDKEIEALEYCLRQLNYSLVTPTLSPLVSVTAPESTEVVEYSLNAFGGFFNLTGQDATFTLGTSSGIDAEAGIFTLTGQDASFTLGVHDEVALDAGTFTLTGQDATFTLTPSPYQLEMFLVEAVAADSGWTARFEMDNSPFTQVDLTCLNNGDSDSNTLASGDTITCSVWKTTNGSVTQEAGYVEFFIDGVSQDLQSFTTAETVDFAAARVYNFTGLSTTSVLRVEIQEA